MAKKKTTPAKKKEENIIKVPFEPANNLLFNGDKYEKQQDGKYLKKGTKEVYTIVKR